jgi:cell division protein FtsQ
MSPIRSRLLVPRVRTEVAADVANRHAVIANQRSALRHTRRSRRRLRTVVRAVGILLGAAIVSLGVVAGARWITTTPWLGVATIEVQGLKRVSEEAVRAATGIEPGTNLLTLNAVAVEARIGRLPGVRAARVVRHLPRHLTVLVEEREPYALVNAGGARPDHLYWVDAEGHPVGPARQPAPASLPILSGVRLPPGDWESVPEDVRTGLLLLRAVQRVGGRVAGRISEIDLTTATDPVLYLADGATVRVGSEAWEDRLSRLEGVLGELEMRGERVAGVDMRFRDLVVLKPRPAAVVAHPRGPVGTIRRQAVTDGSSGGPRR